MSQSFPRSWFSRTSTLHFGATPVHEPCSATRIMSLTPGLLSTCVFGLRCPSRPVLGERTFSMGGREYGERRMWTLFLLLQPTLPFPSRSHSQPTYGTVLHVLYSTVFTFEADRLDSIASSPHSSFPDLHPYPSPKPHNERSIVSPWTTIRSTSKLSPCTQRNAAQKLTSLLVEDKKPLTFSRKQETPNTLSTMTIPTHDTVSTSSFSCISKPRIA